MEPKDYIMKQLTDKLFISNTDVEQGIDKITHHFQNNKPDIIVGIARGGLVPSVYLSHALNVPLEVITWSTRDRDLKEHSIRIEKILSDGGTVLFVDDINDSGRTLQELDDHYSTSEGTCLYATLISKNTSMFRHDISSIELKDDDRWIVFPWEKQ